MMLGRWTPVFRTWGHRRGQRGQPAWSWSNLTRTIRILTMSVWRRCPAFPNLSEAQPGDEELTSVRSVTTSSTSRLPSTILITHTYTHTHWSGCDGAHSLSCQTGSSDAVNMYFYFILQCWSSQINFSDFPSIWIYFLVYIKSVLDVGVFSFGEWLSSFDILAFFSPH